VPVELIFDQSIGHVFVNRIAGNIVTSEIMASIEYGAAVLGTKVIMVLAHGNCGAVKATIDGKAVPGQISSLYRYIRPAVNAAGDNLREATEANAKRSRRSFSKSPLRCLPGCSGRESSRSSRPSSMSKVVG
jgi:carbonic anhydrase